MRLSLFKKILPLLGLLFAFLVLREYLANLNLSLISVSFAPLLISFFMLVLLFFLDATGWYLINKSLRVNASLQETIRVWLLSSLSRYIPGVVWGYANRIIFLKEKNVGLSTITLSLVVESLLLAGGALFVSSYLFFDVLYRKKVIDFLHFSSNLYLAFSFLLFVLFVFIYFFRKKIIGYICDFWSLFVVHDLLVAFVFYLFFWFLFSFSFGVFASSFFLAPLGIAEILRLGFCFSLAFGLSFILIVFPGGIGVREIFLFLFLSVSVEPSMAALISALSRLWVISAEMVAVGWAWIVMRPQKNS